MHRDTPRTSRTLAAAVLISTVSMATAARALPVGTCLMTTTIGFDNVPPNGSPFTREEEDGFFVTPKTSSNWIVANYFGAPSGPFIEFITPAHTTTMGTILITHKGVPFAFNSVELYSSVTTIPYVFTGYIDGRVVFVVQGTVPNTFGNFFQVINPRSKTPIDSLKITLTDPLGGLPYPGSNPVGLDNIIMQTIK